MKTLIKKLIRQEQGLALPAVLIALALGSMLLLPTISYAGTNLKVAQVTNKNVKGLYAAGAGVDDVIWCLKNIVPARTALPQNINGMQVTMATQSMGNRTLFAGEWVTCSSHTNWLDIDTTATLVSGNTYEYTITLNYSGDGNCKLTGIGARIPVGYTYSLGSAYPFETNLSREDADDDDVDGEGAYLLFWPLPSITMNNGDTRTQIFHISGSGDIEGDYGWAVASREDVGQVGELSGDFNIITATATMPGSGEVVAQIVANVMAAGTDYYVTSWQISSQ